MECEKTWTNIINTINDDKVKKAHLKEDIVYHELKIHLVIKKFWISSLQWRRLLMGNQNNIKNLTYDYLLKKAKQRYAEVKSMVYDLEDTTYGRKL